MHLECAGCETPSQLPTVTVPAPLHTALARGHALHATSQAERDAIDELSEEEPITAEIAAQIKTLWEDSGVQEVYGKRSQFQLNDSAA